MHLVYLTTEPWPICRSTSGQGAPVLFVCDDSSRGFSYVVSCGGATLRTQEKFAAVWGQLRKGEDAPAFYITSIYLRCDRDSVAAEHLHRDVLEDLADDVAYVSLSGNVILGGNFHARV